LVGSIAESQSLAFGKNLNAAEYSFNVKYMTEDMITLIAMAESVGLTFTGEINEGSPVFIGDDKAWRLFDKKI